MEPMSKKMEGSSLIEVLISLFVFAIGILGVLSMQAQSIKLNNNAFLYSQANILAVEMVEQLRASPALADEISLGTCTAGDFDSCCGERNTAEASEEDLTAWTQNISRVLPGGRGNIINRDSANGVIEVVVCFDSGVNETTQEFVVGGVNLQTVL